MADQLNVTPSDLSAAGGQLSDVSSQVKAVLSSLQAKLAGYGEPWGDDSTGKSFAEGTDGYIAQRDWVFGAIGNNTEVLDGYSTSLTDSAKNFDQMDNS
jgi:uncharacterized protein YukE